MNFLCQIKHLVVQNSICLSLVLNNLRDQTYPLLHILLGRLVNLRLILFQRQLVTLRAAVGVLINNSTVEKSMLVFINFVDHSRLVVFESLIKQILLQ